MKILLYNPDNGVTQNFMPHLWMFLLQSLTPAGNEVLLIDGNTHPLTDHELVQYALDQKIGLVGIGAMTRMIAKAYRVADALRAAGVPVVMGGPHVTECPDEALGRDGGPRHADAIALGEADETWPRIVADAVRGQMKEVYTPVDAFGQEKKPTLQGSVANSKSRTCSAIRFRSVLHSDAEQSMDELTLAHRITLCQPADLSFANRMHCLVAFDGSPGSFHRPES